MKKLTSLALAAVMSLGLAGCAKDAADNTPKLGSDKLMIRIKNPHLRAIEAAATAGQITTEDHDMVLFIANAGGTIVYNAVLNQDEALDAAGQTITNIPEDAASVFITANVDVTPNDFHTLNELKAEVFDIADFTDYTVPPMANATGAEVAITPSGASGDPATVSVSLSPVIARLELAKVRGTENIADPTDPTYVKITGFDVTGVYLYDYFEEFKLDASSNGSAVGAPFTDGDSYTGTKDEGTWTAAADGVDFSAFTGADLAATDRWAYNVVAADLPRLVIRLENVTAVDGEDSAITNILNEATTDDLDDEILLAGTVFYLTMPAADPYDGVAAFERGKVYQINEVVFSSTNLFDVPIREDLDLVVDVNVVDWVFEPITSNLN